MRAGVTPLVSLMLCCLLGPGCGESRSPTQPGRKSLGKADLTGSCRVLENGLPTLEDNCGGKSVGTCWCDDQCAGYKDCCDDYVAVCEFEPPTIRRTLAKSLSFDDETTKVTVAFFDADSTLRISKSGKKSPNGPDDVMLLPGVVKGVSDAVLRGEVVAVVSNQGGVHYGYLTFADAQSALAKTAALLSQKRASVHYFDFATSYGNDRKPKTGMATRLSTKLKDSLGVDIDWASSCMVGDAGWKKDVDQEPDGTPGIDFSNSDRKFAEALTIPFHHPRSFFGWSDHGVRRFDKPQQVEDFWQAHPNFPE